MKYLIKSTQYLRISIMQSPQKDFTRIMTVFQFRNKVNKLENGWYKYGKDFVNILVALDPCNKINGSIEVSKAHKTIFSRYSSTNKDGTNLKNETKYKFKLIKLNIGDILIFKNSS